jgi:hypothetical protein
LPVLAAKSKNRVFSKSETRFPSSVHQLNKSVNPAQSPPRRMSDLGRFCSVLEWAGMAGSERAVAGLYGLFVSFLVTFELTQVIGFAPRRRIYRGKNR